jgi:hypothetical protein
VDRMNPFMEQMQEAMRDAVRHGICPQCQDRPAAPTNFISINGESSELLAALCDPCREDWRRP